MFGAKFPKLRPDWLVGPNGKRLELDGYCKEFCLAFEHHGEQHYKELKFSGNSGFVVGDQERGALLKLPQRWKKQNAALLFSPLLGKVKDNFSTAPTTPATAKLTESFGKGLSEPCKTVNSTNRFWAFVLHGMSTGWTCSWKAEKAPYSFTSIISKNGCGRVRNAGRNARSTIINLNDSGGIWTLVSIKRSCTRRRPGRTVPSTELKW